MLVIHGTYRLFPRRIAFRNDSCLTCAAARRAILISTFDVIHVFWVPLVPIGRWKRWTCSVCGKRPDENRESRRSFKIAGLILLIVFAVVFWLTPVDAQEPAASWIFRIGFPLGALATAIHLARWTPKPGYKEALQTVAPANDLACPFCAVPLVQATLDCYCPACQVKRL
jgi:hypothetical protein